MTRKMMMTIGIIAMTLAGPVVALLSASMAWAQGAPYLYLCHVSPVGPTFAMLNCGFHPYGAPSHIWFDLGTSADLAQTRRVGEQRYEAMESATEAHAQLNGLR